MNTIATEAISQSLTSGFALSFPTFRDLVAAPNDDRFGISVRVNFNNGHSEYLHYSQYDVNPKTGAFRINHPIGCESIDVDFECYSGHYNN
jgi:hypothetical protein